MAVSNTLFPRPNPCDFFVFPKKIIPCKVQRFNDVPEIEAEIETVLGKRDFQEIFAAVGQTGGFVKISAVKATLCTGASINLYSYFLQFIIRFG